MYIEAYDSPSIIVKESDTRILFLSPKSQVQVKLDIIWRMFELLPKCFSDYDKSWR